MKPTRQRGFADDFEDRGLLTGVDPANIDETHRLLRLVDTTLHRAVENQDLVAIRRLMDAGYSPGALDWAGMTPLHVCIVKKIIEPLTVLLSYKGSTDVRDASGLTVLHVAILHRWHDGVCAALSAGADVAAESPAYVSKAVIERRYQQVTLLQFGLRFYEETIVHLAVKSENIEILDKILAVAQQKACVELFNRRGVTPLYTAIKSGCLEAVQALIKRGASVNIVSDRYDTALHVAVHEPNILKYLLDNTDVVNYLNDFGSDPIHIAVSCNKMDSVKLLLNKTHVKRRDRAQGKGRIALMPIEPRKSIFYRPPEKWLRYLCCILCRPEPGGTWFHRCSPIAARFQCTEPSIMQMDDNGCTPLHIAAKQRNTAMVVLLLRKGAKLLTKGPNGRSALEIIATEFYNPSNCFELIFDEFINTHQVLSDSVVKVDYKALTDCNDVSQIKVIEELVRCGQKKILVHPLIESLLYLKWRYLLPVFYAMIGVYSTFLVAFNIFVINIIYYRDINNSSFYIASNLNGVIGWFEFFDRRYWVLIILIYASIILLLLQESFYIHLKGLRYFVQLETWVKLGCLVLGAIVPLVMSCAEPAVWQRHTVSAALLLTWLHAMFLLSRFPTWGYLVLVFGKVATNVFKILVSLICLVIGFSFCFMIQYHSAPPFNGPFAAFVKTLVMMSSEFDYEDLFGEDHDKDLQDTRTIVRIFFVSFVVFVAIVLMNFMIGIAVSDINELHVKGNIRRLEKQVELLSTLDILINKGFFSQLYKKKFGDKRYHEKILNFIGFQTKWRAALKDGDSCCYQINLPSDLHNAIVEIAWRKKQRDDNNKNNKANKYKLSALYHAVVDTAAIDDHENERKQNETNVKTKSKLNDQMKSLANGLLEVNSEVKHSIDKISHITLDLERIKLMLANLTCDKTDKAPEYAPGVQLVPPSHSSVLRMRSYSR